MRKIYRKTIPTLRWAFLFQKPSEKAYDYACSLLERRKLPVGIPVFFPSVEAIALTLRCSPLAVIKGLYKLHARGYRVRIHHFTAPVVLWHPEPKPGRVLR